jgi:hypothetical protein
VINNGLHNRYLEDISMQGLVLVTLTLFVSLTLHAQEAEKESKRKGPGPEDISTDSLISEPGPAFRVPHSKVGEHTKVIVFGDQRFTDPTNTSVTNPKPLNIRMRFS